MYETVSANFIMESIHSKVGRKFQLRKQELETLRNRVLQSNEWDREKLYTDYVSSNKNPLKNYEQTSVGRHGGSDGIALDRSHSMQDLRILSQIKVLPNICIKKNGELVEDSEQLAQTVHISAPSKKQKKMVSNRGHLQLDKARKKKHGSLFRIENNLSPSSNPKNQILLRTSSVKVFQLPTLPPGLVPVNQHLNEFYFTTGRVKGRYSDSWNRLNQNIKELRDGNRETQSKVDSLLQKRKDLINENLNLKAADFAKKTKEDITQFERDDEIQTRIKAKLGQTETNYAKKSGQNRSHALAKAVPKSRVDIYSPRRAFQQYPYKSYWMSCVEQLLSADSPHGVEEPGYYKLVCNNLERKVLDASQLSELDIAQLEIAQEVY